MMDLLIIVYDDTHIVVSKAKCKVLQIYQKLNIENLIKNKPHK